MDRYFLFNHSQNRQQSTPTEAAAIEMITEPSRFVDAGDSWSIHYAPGDVGAASLLHEGTGPISKRQDPPVPIPD